MGRKRDTDSLVREPPAQLDPGQRICRVEQICGNNLYSVLLPPHSAGLDSAGHDSADALTPPATGTGTATAEKVLVELPPKFRNTLWIRRGGFVLVDLAAGAARSNKIAGDIAAVIQDARPWRKMDYWPWPLPSPTPAATTAAADDDDDEDEDDLLQANTNRRRYDTDED